MGKVKTLVSVVTAAALLASFDPRSGVAQAVPTSPEARAVVFAHCAGRFSAELEHAWLVGKSGTAAASGRSQMIALLEAVSPVSGLAPRELLAARIDAKMAHAALLTRAVFRGDRRAAALAAGYVARCAEHLPLPLELVALR